MATKANLVLDQGSTFSVDLTLQDENGDALLLAGYTANSQMRKWYTSINPSAVFNASVNAQLGTITLSLEASNTSNLTAGRYVYDVRVTNPSGESTRVVEGIVTINPEVTQ